MQTDIYDIRISSVPVPNLCFMVVAEKIQLANSLIGIICDRLYSSTEGRRNVLGMLCRDGFASIPEFYFHSRPRYPTLDIDVVLDWKRQ